MKMAVFQWFRCFARSPPFGAFSWPLAGLWLLLASCWPLVFTRLAKLVNSLHENGCFSMVSVFRGVPPIWGRLLASDFLLASCWPLAGLLLASRLLLASCWPLASLLLASCWPLAGLLLASCWLLAGYKVPHEESLENRFFTRLAKLMNSLHENGCSSMVSVFRGVPPIWGRLLASC